MNKRSISHMPRDVLVDVSAAEIDGVSIPEPIFDAGYTSNHLTTRNLPFIITRHIFPTYRLDFTSAGD